MDQFVEHNTRDIIALVSNRKLSRNIKSSIFCDKDEMRGLAEYCFGRLLLRFFSFIVVGRFEVIFWD